MEKAKKTCGHSQGVLQIGVHSSLVDAHDLAEHLILAMQKAEIFLPFTTGRRLQVTSTYCMYMLVSCYNVVSCCIIPKQISERYMNFSVLSTFLMWQRVKTNSTPFLFTSK